jgi:prepilin-type processing-associated H-X9-DG protein
VRPSSRAWLQVKARVDPGARARHTHGAIAQTLFNTVVIPNLQQNQSTHTSNTSTSALGTSSNADSLHPGGVNTQFGDGRVCFIKESMNQRAWWALGTKAGSEVICSDNY